MKLRYKIAGGFLALTTGAMIVLALVISHNTACEPTPELASDKARMKAIVGRCFGGPEVLTLEEVEIPKPAANEVLVKVKAASVNPLDWHYMRGAPYIMRLMGVGIGTPSDVRLGVDFSGIVEAIGTAVTQYKPGDEVFGSRSGAFAEYVLVPSDRALAMKPANMSFEQAAAVPVAAITALQALRDKGQIKPGQKVLINGASGGVGTFAVQIAKSYGAEVTGVCSARNADMVRSIGADHVIDYKTQDYTEMGQQYDLIIDNVGNHSLSKNRKAMSPDGSLVMVGGATGNWLAALVGPISALLYSPFVDQKFIMHLARMRQQDLVVLGELMKSGEITPVIDRSYTLSEVPDAIRYSEEGHARGKIIINLDQGVSE
jgi:NADPH:quinone reductase-like Zn-dependent oxidoreductase